MLTLAWDDRTVAEGQGPSFLKRCAMLETASCSGPLTHFTVAADEVRPRRRLLAMLGGGATFVLFVAIAAAFVVSGGHTGGREGPSRAPDAGAVLPPLATLRGATTEDRANWARRQGQSRLAELRVRQDRLTRRQARLAALLGAAQSRNIVLDPETMRPAAGSEAPVLARLAALPAAAPRPIPGDAGALSLQAADLPPAARRAADLDVALRGLERTQDVILAALERATEARIAELARFPARLGIEMELHGTGGPLIELRGVEAPLESGDRFEVFHAALREVDELERVVAALPIRSPLEGKARVTSGFGRRQDPFLGRQAMHAGIDLAAPRGTPVRATGSGTIRFAGWNGGYGRMVEIDHGNGHRTRYGHLSRIGVATGEAVRDGDAIGAVGSSGRSTGPHLHYELVRDGRRRDPGPYLDMAELVGEKI